MTTETHFSGGFKAGFKEGEGVFEVINGDVYSGRFRAGKRNGLGIETFHTGGAGVAPLALLNGSLMKRQDVWFLANMWYTCRLDQYSYIGAF